MLNVTIANFNTNTQNGMHVVAVITGGFTSHHETATSFAELQAKLSNVDWFFVREVYFTVIENGVAYSYNGSKGLINGNGPHLESVKSICSN